MLDQKSSNYEQKDRSTRNLVIIYLMRLGVHQQTEMQAMKYSVLVLWA